jgi:DNA-binding LacI/PurR family transcriptional regulator
MDRATYADIARHAGVSTASVSRALSGRDGVSPEVASRVRQSAAALGYRGNRAARALRRQRADAIGLVVSDIENPFFASIVRAVEGVAARHGHAVLLCNTDEDLAQERQHLELLMGESVAGVIAVPSVAEGDPLLELPHSGIPTVLFDRNTEGASFDCVMVDHRAGGRELVQHLIGHGHRHIGVISGSTATAPTTDRLRGCRDAVGATSGVRLTVFEGGPKDAIGVEKTFKLGERLMRQLVSMPDRPTAVFCVNNLLSLGALRGLRGTGLRVPDDIAIVGFDDEPFFELLETPLTVASQPVARIGRQAANLLFMRIGEPSRPVRRLVLSPQLKIRASCGCREEHRPSAE